MFLLKQFYFQFVNDTVVNNVNLIIVLIKFNLEMNK